MNWINNLFFGRFFMTKDVDVAKNYTDDMVERMEQVYSANPTRATAEELAEEFDKPVRSVIAKLSSMGIYKAQARMTKTGAPIIRKADIVNQIEAALGTEMPTLAKASKIDLLILKEKVLGVTVLN
tara:strand:+ start:150 stop:527 length:378 start_codon:yes stop_codon:yes gene_type:complete